MMIDVGAKWHWVHIVVAQKKRKEENLLLHRDEKRRSTKSWE